MTTPPAAPTDTLRATFELETKFYYWFYPPWVPKAVYAPVLIAS